MSNKVIELFGHSTRNQSENWGEIVQQQNCPFLGKTCFKVRKSDPSISIGTCSVLYRKQLKPIVICPARLLERRQVFVDCLHLLRCHEPGNELHVISEIIIPGGRVDYFLASVRSRKVKDFVGIEFQTLDTTGTVWAERQRMLNELGVATGDVASESRRLFGMNWKMAAKTILVQMHHKVETFEQVNRKLVLVVQDSLLEYMKRVFNFGHLSEPALIGDAMHFHSYRVDETEQRNFRLELDSRLSTDADGIGQCLGLQAEAQVELEQIIEALERKISNETRLSVGA